MKYTLEAIDIYDSTKRYWECTGTARMRKGVFKRKKEVKGNIYWQSEIGCWLFSTQYEERRPRDFETHIIYWRHEKESSD